MILHQVTKPAAHYSHSLLAQRVTKDDIILLMSDACYDIAQFLKLQCTVKVLKTDAMARNVTVDESMHISDGDWVSLTLNSQNIISW